jgi:hypothetical protein
MGQSEPVDLQQHLQQPRAFRLRLGFGQHPKSLFGKYKAFIHKYLQQPQTG